MLRIGWLLCGLFLLAACTNSSETASAEPEAVAVEEPASTDSVAAETEPLSEEIEPADVETEPLAAEATTTTEVSPEEAPALDLDLLTTYVSTAVIEFDGEPRELIEGTNLRVSFSEERINFSGGCNSHSSTFRITDEGEIDVDQIVGTAVGCPQELVDQDNFLRSFLQRGPSIEVDDLGLTLTSSTGGVIELIYFDAPERRPPLVGTEWVFLVLDEGAEAVRFLDESTFEWSVTCVDVTTSVEISFGSAEDPSAMNVGSLIFDPATVPLTRSDVRDLDCSRSEMDRAMGFSEILSGEVTFEIEGTFLTVVGVDGFDLSFFAAN